VLLHNKFMPLLLSITYLKPEHLSNFNAEGTGPIYEILSCYQNTIITYSSQLVFIIKLKHDFAFTTYLLEDKLFHCSVFSVFT
jgi:hypothetical protein